MKEFLYFDKDKLSPEDFNRSLMFGEGAFETFRFKQKLPVFLDRHLQSCLLYTSDAADE